VFANSPGDGEATPMPCPGGGDAFGEAALAGEAAGEDGGPAFAEASAGELETAAP
jgi:hypothetical protein